VSRLDVIPQVDGATRYTWTSRRGTMALDVAADGTQELVRCHDGYQERQDMTLAIPSVRCGKCLGRIDQQAIDMKRKLHAKLRPTEPFVGPKLCSDCWLQALLDLCAAIPEEDE
jgi:hypothetical protein